MSACVCVFVWANFLRKEPETENKIYEPMHVATFPHFHSGNFSLKVPSVNILTKSYCLGK